MHWEGLCRAHPYLSDSASLNAPFWMAKPWFCNQLEAPFSLASFLARCNGSGNLSWTLAAAWSSCFRFVCSILLLAWRCGITLWASCRSVCLWMISMISGNERCRDVWCSLSAFVAGLMMTRPPFLVGIVPGALSLYPQDLVSL